MTPDEIRDLLPARALGALDPSEAEAVDAAIVAHPDLLRELEDLRAAVSSMRAELPPATAPPELLSAVLGRIDAGEPAASDGSLLLAAVARPDGTRGRRWTALPRPRRLRLLAGGLALAAAVVALAVIFLASTRSVDPVSGRATLDGHGAHGQARLYRDHVVVELSDLTPPPAGHHYQVWVLPRGSQAMRSVGTLRPRNGAASLEAALPGSGPYAAVDVSVDPDDRPATEPGPSVVRAPFS